MRRLLLAPLAAAFLSASIPAAAHSLKDFEEELHEQERYAQFMDKVAPDFALADAAGNAVTLADFRGKVVVLNFIYTRCTDVCPLHMNTIKQLQGMVNAAGLRQQVQFITIATDTEDLAPTRENMRAYGQNFAFDPANWRFLFRTEAQPTGTTAKVADAYGLKFTVAEDGVQMHGVVTHVIDQSGRMRARFHGLKFEPEHLVSYVKAVARGPDAVSEGFWHGLNTYFKAVFNKE